MGTTTWRGVHAVRLGLTILDGLLGGTAVLGGAALLFGWLGIPLELLAGSPFMSYTVPALALIVLVGGSGVLATVLLLRRSATALAVSGVAGLIIVVFEMVELRVIGFSWLLALYVVLGLAILALTLRLWLVVRDASADTVARVRTSGLT